MGVTIKDIAKIAGVSISTVSLVISGKGYVSAETRMKIKKVIDEFNYMPSRPAQQLATNRTGNIGFIISDLHLSRSEAFYSRILLGAELEARNHDMYILLSTVGESLDIPENVPRFLTGKNVDGIIVAGGVAPELVNYIKSLKIPCVLIDFQVEGSGLDSVNIDNRNGITQIVNHLRKNGVEKIGFVCGSFYHPSIKERFEGYQSAMSNHGLREIAFNSDYHSLVEHETSVECGFRGTAALLKKVPDIEAIVCANDTTAIGCLQYITDGNSKINHEIRVTGFDDVNFAALSNPPLTTVHVPKVQLGVEGLKLLVDRIQNGKSVHQTRLIPVELVERESSKGVKPSNGQRSTAG